MRILIVEDDEIINQNLNRLLSMNGYAADSSFSKDDAITKLYLSNYDLVLLDIGLPGGSGIDVLKEFRTKNNNSGVIVISARDSKKIIQEALDCGADDYMVKPIDFDELLSRIHAVSRRMSTPIKGIIEIKELRIDRDKMVALKFSKRSQVWKEIELTKKEFSILEYLAVCKGQVQSQEQIIEHAWDENADLFSGAIRTHIKNLRKKTGDLIHTVKGAGYVIR